MARTTLKHSCLWAGPHWNAPTYGRDCTETLMPMPGTAMQYSCLWPGPRWKTPAWMFQWWLVAAGLCHEFGRVPASKFSRALFISLRNFGSHPRLRGSAKICDQKLASDTQFSFRGQFLGPIFGSEKSVKRQAETDKVGCMSKYTAQHHWFHLPAAGRFNFLLCYHSCCNRTKGKCGWHANLTTRMGRYSCKFAAALYIHCMPVSTYTHLIGNSRVSS